METKSKDKVWQFIDGRRAFAKTYKEALEKLSIKKAEAKKEQKAKE